MQELRIRVETTESFFARAREDARRIDAGDYTPQPSELSFENLGTMFDLLSGNRWTLLDRLRALGPTSIRALSKALGRDYRGVHADVGRLLDVGLIEKNEAGKILVPWSKIVAEVTFDKAA